MKRTFVAIAVAAAAMIGLSHVANADALDHGVSEVELVRALAASPWAERIPPLLRQLRNLVGGAPQQRLSQGG